MIPLAEVIGDPIVQSKSPVIQCFWLDALGLEGEYRRAHVTSAGLPDYLAQARDRPEWRGCNVTLPHKIAVLDLIDDAGDVGDSIGAINTILRRPDGSLTGTNTDAGGFAAPIVGRDLAGAHVAVVGAGGAARAVMFALSRFGVGRVTVLNRSPAKAAGLLDGFGLAGEVLPLGAALASDIALLVNTSALGMTGQPPLDLDLSPLGADAVVYDIVYSPLETPLLAQARARGLTTVDGLDMLIGQAALAFELFFDAAPPRDRDDDLRALLTA